METSDRYQSEIRENERIVYAGLEFYPLTVRDYSLYSNAKPSIELMQASLPPNFARLSWCVCLDEMDKYNAEHGEKTEYLNAFLYVLVKALRLQPRQSPNGNVVYPIYPVNSKDTGRLTHITVIADNNVDYTFFDTKQLGEIRRIVAAQNMYSIPDESWNPDLLRAAQYTEQAKKASLVYDLESLVYSVAVNSGVRAKEVWGWTIREFEQTQRAIERTLNYQIFTQASMSGFVTFKNGNPCSSWRFDTKSDMPADFIRMDELDAGAKGLLKSNDK